jgi:hypothetical protein
MGQIAISRDGVFKLDDRAYRIPWKFSRRPVLSYRALTEPLQVSASLKALTAEQRIISRKYFLWRAVVCLIPEFRETDPKSLSLPDLDRLHEWIARHRPELLAD